MMIPSVFLALAASAAGMVQLGSLPGGDIAAAAAPQSGREATLNQVSDAQCRDREDEIVVCGRVDRFTYRLQPQADGFDPDGPIDSVARERHRLLEGGESGIGSCSPVGPGGTAGCGARRFRDAELQGRKTGIFANVGIGVAARSPNSAPTP